MTLLPYSVTDEIVSLSEELDAWRRLLDIRLLPRAWEGRLRRDLEAEAVAASTRMEGITVADTLFIEIDSAESARDRIITELGRRLRMSGEASGFPRRPFSEESRAIEKSG